MKHLTQLGAFLVLVTATVPACDVETIETGPTLTKEEAQARGGKSDHGIDFCDVYGWYGDGICDPWCAYPDPDCAANECEAIGGACLSSPLDVTFSANCQADFGLAPSDASCGDVINLACCVPGGDDDTGDDDTGDDDTGDDDTGDDDTPESCEALGGSCLSSPLDVTFGADCEGDFGLQTLSGDCTFFNQSCCG